MLLPVFVLALAECGLRLAGYGYSTSFFRRVRTNNEEFLVQNDKFALRFFPPEIARPPGPIRMKANKEPGTYRIFIFGESAAMGDPEPAFGAWRYLETLLRQRFPEANFEVINAAFTAINSHVILPVARECSRHEGDLWIIYMGNNEMTGPFGAATAFGPKAPPLPLIRLTLALQKLRLGQLMMGLGRKLVPKPSGGVARGAREMFSQSQIAPDDPHKQAVYRNFENNLEGIVEAGRRSGAKILLSTVAVNLKDCPPLASMANSNLPAAERAKFDELHADGLRAEGQENFGPAARQYESAAKLDPTFAELQFRWSHCLLGLRNVAEAREHLQLACDSDALPFRTDSRLNDIIRMIGREHASTNLALLEAAAALSVTGVPPTFDPLFIPGKETFWEHVHFTFDGNYRLGLAWARQVETFLPGSLKRRAASDWATEESCARQLGLTDQKRALVLQSIIRRLVQPPFSNQSNNRQRLEELRAQEKELRQ
jgi:hypothetical protein